ncbi:MAG: LamG-like jellyroll fold domain-containing protein, partial [bacterium]
SGVSAILYIDGVQIGTANSLNATTTGANKLWIGRFHGDNNYTIAGNIPIAKVYNRALTASEVLTNFNHYKTRFNIT